MFVAQYTKTMNALEIPIGITWEVTNRCNLKCKHCFISSPIKKEVTTKEAKVIIDKLAELKMLYLEFTGGEPLLRNDFFEICYYDKKKGIKFLFLITNGTCINNNNIEKIKELFYEVQVSLDGATKTVHESIRGKGSFDKTLNAIKLLVKHGVRTSISMTVHKLNVHDIPNMIKLCTKIGIERLKIGLLRPVTKDHFKLSLSLKEVSDVIVYLHKKKKELKDKVKIYPPARRKLQEADLLASNWSCGAGITKCTILPQGDLVPCPLLREYTAGNMLKEDFVKIWREGFKFVRELTVERIFRRAADYGRDCFNCEYYPDLCRGGCRAVAIAFYNNPLAPDPYCLKEMTKINKELKKVLIDEY